MLKCLGSVIHDISTHERDEDAGGPAEPGGIDPAGKTGEQHRHTEGTLVGAVVPVVTKAGRRAFCPG